MADQLDALDRKILTELQSDATRSLDEIARLVGSSKTPVWNRIRKMRANGIIRKEAAILDPEAIGLDSCFYVFVQTSRHDADWLRQFLEAVQRRPEIVEAHRLAGDVDYILKVRVKDAKAYDAFYQALISDVSIHKVSSALSMEEIKFETALPVD